jgi:hypothetical protein
MLDEFDLDHQPWPRSGDDPFGLDSRSRLVACLNFTHDEPWIGYVEGFKRLADLGVAHLEETGHGHDFLVYPIVYAYRHHIELALKMVIRSARAVLDEQGDLPKTHKLLALWDVAEPLLRAVADDQETYGAVRECLVHFDELDPTSESFRYPVTASGEAVLPGVRSLDLGKVREVVERVSTFLDCAAQELTVRLDVQSEIEDAYRVAW